MALTDAQLDAIRVRVTETAKLYTGGLRPGQAARDRAALLAEVDRLRAEAALTTARKNAARWLAGHTGEVTSDG